MEQKIIKIPSVDYGKVSTNREILTSLGAISGRYRSILIDPDEHLNTLINEYDEIVKSSATLIDSRRKEWTKLLGKYYKMTYRRETPYMTYEHISYIFPYKLIETNNTLWLLEVDGKSDYQSGVKDVCYTLDENWNYDIYLQEITEEEFRNKAMETTKNLIDRRLKKLSGSKIKLNHFSFLK